MDNVNLKLNVDFPEDLKKCLITFFILFIIFLYLILGLETIKTFKKITKKNNDYSYELNI